MDDERIHRIRSSMIASRDLRSRRVHLGFSRDQLAHTLGVSENELAAWEEGSERIAYPAAVEQVLHKREESLRYEPADGETRIF